MIYIYIYIQETPIYNLTDSNFCKHCNFLCDNVKSLYIFVTVAQIAATQGHVHFQKNKKQPRGMKVSQNTLAELCHGHLLVYQLDIHCFWKDEDEEQ